MCWWTASIPSKRRFNSPCWRKSRQSVEGSEAMMQALPRITLCLLICGLAPIGGWSAETCHSVSLTAELFAGQGFERMIGGDLVFRFHPEKLGHDGQLDGWSVALSPKSSPRQDYIYPVNPPIRFNG